MTTRATLRALSSDEIARYVEFDEPLDCAGSFKWERLGISLMSELQGSDPTTLEELPLIKLCSMLRNEGILVPNAVVNRADTRKYELRALETTSRAAGQGHIVITLNKCQRVAVTDEATGAAPLSRKPDGAPRPLAPQIHTAYRPTLRTADGHAGIVV